MSRSSGRIPPEGGQDFETYITNLILQDAEAGRGHSEKTSDQRRNRCDSSFLRRVLERTEGMNQDIERRAIRQTSTSVGPAAQQAGVHSWRATGSRTTRDSSFPYSRMDHYFDKASKRRESGAPIAQGRRQHLRKQPIEIPELDDLNALIPELPSSLHSQKARSRRSNGADRRDRMSAKEIDKEVQDQSAAVRGTTTHRDSRSPCRSHERSRDSASRASMAHSRSCSPASSAREWDRGKVVT